jgi:hypothetical protein
MAPDPKSRPTLYKTKDISQAGIFVNKSWKNLRRNVFKEAAAGERYPFYAMSVPDVLKLEHWRPHQELLRMVCSSSARPRTTLSSCHTSGSAFVTRTRTANSSPA